VKFTDHQKHPVLPLDPDPSSPAPLPSSLSAIQNAPLTYSLSATQKHSTSKPATTTSPSPNYIPAPIEGAEDISLRPLKAEGPEVGAGLGLGWVVRAWTQDTSSTNYF
jgi:hypothetical protein